MFASTKHNVDFNRILSRQSNLNEKVYTFYGFKPIVSILYTLYIET